MSGQTEYHTIVKPIEYRDFVEFEQYTDSGGKPILSNDVGFVSRKVLELREDTGLNLQMAKWDPLTGIIYV